MKLFASLQRSSFILPRSPGRLLGCPRGSSAPKSVRQRCLGHDPWRRTPLQPWLLAALPGGPPLTGRGLLAKGHVDLHTHTHHSRILWIWVDDRQQEWWNRQDDVWYLIDWEMLSRNYSPARWDWRTQLCSSDPHPKAIQITLFPFSELFDCFQVPAWPQHCDQQWRGAEREQAVRRIFKDDILDLRSVCTHLPYLHRFQLNSPSRSSLITS